nr:olfactory receptor 53 [Gregopimpla kuwanae]
MQILQHTFIVLKWVGLWRPGHWSQGKEAKLYNAYTWLVIFFLIIVILSQFIGLVKSVNDLDAFANNIFLLLTLVADCGKAINILIKRENIIGLINCLEQDPCQPRTEEELVIQRKFDRIVRFNTLRYAAVVLITVFVALLNSMYEDIPKRTLPFNAWVPFEYVESRWRYAAAYTYQTFGILIGAGIGIGFDTLVPGMMLQTCAQLNILMNRFNKMPEMLRASNSVIPNAEITLLAQNVKHHITIFNFAEKSNAVFGIMIFVQYAISSSVICVSLLRLSKVKLFSSMFAALFVCLAEMSIQILLYCYYGGEVGIESLKVFDAVYEMDWPTLSMSARKSLLTIMVRTLRPIKFTTAHVITLNLESFKSLIKFSYSTYNVLGEVKA